MAKVIVRIKGGLGNQLFCYAAARRLALVNGVELVIDDVTGFIRDRGFKRQYALNNFNIDARKATSVERLEPFERYRRGFLKYISRARPFKKKCYIEQEGNVFDARLLSLKVKRNIYLDGYWQSEKYFKDVEGIIRQDLDFSFLMDKQNQSLAKRICHCNSVAVHVRWFDNTENETGKNVPACYYQHAFTLMEKKLESPLYFVFSDNLEAARVKLFFPEGRTFFVSHNQGNRNFYADLWLMSQCRHFIIANSTFSWWGAWLSKNLGKIVMAPGPGMLGLPENFIPEQWMKVDIGE